MSDRPVFLLTDDTDDRPLVQAINEADETLIRVLLAAGANPNHRGQVSRHGLWRSSVHMDGHGVGRRGSGRFRDAACLHSRVLLGAFRYHERGRSANAVHCRCRGFCHYQRRMSEFDFGLGRGVGHLRNRRALREIDLLRSVRRGCWCQTVHGW